MRNIRFTVTFESDWHIGTGTGHFGHIDRVFARDEEGLPHIPAKTMTGLLRESMSQIVYGLDEGQSGPWHLAMEWLLGSEPSSSVATFERGAPRRSHVWMDRALVPSEVAAVLTSTPRILSVLPVIRPGVKLDEWGTAEDDHLRFTEMAPAGLVLYGSCQIPDVVSAPVVSLLVSSLRNIRGVGHGRRRGTGRCRVEVLDGVSGLSADDLRSLDVSNFGIHAEDQTAELGNSGSEVVIELHLRTLGPVLVPRSVKGNEVESRDSIPGSTVIGFLGSIAPGSVAAGLREGRLRVGEAIPSDGEVSTVPVPFSWMVDKHGAEGVVKNVASGDGGPIAGQLRQVRRGFVRPSESDWLIVHARHRSRVHNSVDDLSQRPTERTGGLFSYQALDIGQDFVSTVVMDEGVAESILQEIGGDDLLECLSGEARIGTSRKDDYGKVSVVARRSFGSSSQSDQGRAVLLLVSNAIIDNGRGRATASTSAFVALLGEQLGTTLELDDSVHTRRERRESFHGRWNLPRPTLSGLQSGSVIVVRLTDQSLYPKLAEIGRHGIGHRTTEGFGRFVVDHPAVTVEETSFRAAAARPFHLVRPSDPEVPTDFIRGLAEQAIERLVSERISEAIATRRHQKDLGFVASTPKPSQLGALRSVIRYSGDSLSLLTSWWEGVKAVGNRVAQWPDGSREQMNILLADPKRVFTLLRIDVAEIEELLRASVPSEYVSVMIDRAARKGVLSYLSEAARTAQKFSSSEGKGS